LTYDYAAAEVTITSWSLYYDHYSDMQQNWDEWGYFWESHEKSCVLKHCPIRIKFPQWQNKYYR